MDVCGIMVGIRSSGVEEGHMQLAKERGDGCVKVDFSKDEAAVFMETIQAENDAVRIVDPVRQAVVSVEGEEAGGPACCGLWGREERCENCTSLRALRTEGLSYKMEVCNHRTYWVFSRFIRVEGMPYVIEIVNDVTDKLLGTDEYGETGRLIEHHNHARVSDPLTGAYNRRFLEEHIVPSLQECQRAGIPVNLAIMDMDNFKRVNDTYGHQAGDAVLRDVAGFWRQQFNSRAKRRERMLVRFGGDEMLIITCGMELEDFRMKIQRGYSQMRKVCYYRNAEQIPFSISFGVASSTEMSGDWCWEDLMTQADSRMYARKKKRENM